MKRNLSTSRLASLAFALTATLAAIPDVLGQQVPSFRDVQEANQRAQYQERLQQILADKAAYAASIVARWEASARASGRWDDNYATDLQAALMRLPPDNLLAAGEAPSYKAMMTVLATGRPAPILPPDSNIQTLLPQALGDVTDDLVYTPVTPCRIVDTRSAAGGVVVGGSTRFFDMDGSTFTSQGGFNGSCGITFGVARAVAMTITVTQPSSAGYFTVWGLGAQPLTSTLNYTAGQTIANSAIVPVVPGVGSDFSLFSTSTAHVVIDVVGFFAAPIATPLDCITISSAVTAVQVNSWTAIDATCTTGRTATGGGYNTTEGTLGYPGVWLTTLPNGGNGWRTWVDNQTNGARNIQTFVNCCRLPGR